MVYSRKYCFKHLYMIKIPLVAFNQNETCYFVKYKVLLNVAKVSVTITMPTALWSRALPAQPHVHTQYVTRNQQVLCLLTNILKLHRVPGQRSRTVSVPDYKTRPNFIMVITQTATSTVKQQSPQSQNQTSTLNRHGNKHETPKPLNKRQAVLWVSCISWQTWCPLGTSGTSLRNLIYRSQSFQRSEIHCKEANAQGERAEWQPGQVLPSAWQPRALSLSLHLGKNTASRVFPLCPTITHTTNRARGFLPEEQELVKELLNAKSE